MKTPVTDRFARNKHALEGPECREFVEARHMRDMESSHADAFRWLAYGQTGTSSKCMLMCHLGLTEAHRISEPGDCNDLERCILLVQAVPSVRESFPAIAAMSPVWAAVVQAWDGLEQLYKLHGNSGKWVGGLKGKHVLGAYQSAAQDVILGVR